MPGFVPAQTSVIPSSGVDLPHHAACQLYRLAFVMYFHTEVKLASLIQVYSLWQPWPDMFGKWAAD